MINKTDLLKQLTQKSQGQTNERLDKKVVLDRMANHFKPKADGQSTFLKKVPKQPDLAEPKKSIKFESSFTRPKHDIRSITRKVIVESETAKQSPNAMRLDLTSIVLDNIHAKFNVTRGGAVVAVELLYPNAKQEITVKVSVSKGEDRICSVNLEDENFTVNFGAFILKEVDKAVLNSNNKPQYSVSGDESKFYDASVGGTANPPVLPSLGGYAPVWESSWLNAMALVEADDEEITDEAPAEGDSTEGDAAGADAAGDVNADGDGGFGAADFSIDSAGGGGGDLGGFGGGDFGGGGAAPGGAGDVNSDPSGSAGGEPEEEMVKFKDKTDWTQAALDEMQKLTADSTAKQMQSGNGVVLSSNDILKGTVGIENDSNFQIVSKFLKVYKELDGVDIPVTMMNEIEDKLSKNDGQFDAFLQQNLGEITGQSDVDDTLNNDMFADFKPMGGEEAPAPGGDAGLEPFDEFMNGNFGEDQSEPNEFDDLFGTEDDEDDQFGATKPGEEDIIKGIAEKSTGGKPADTFPNLS